MTEAEIASLTPSQREQVQLDLLNKWLSTKIASQEQMVQRVASGVSGEVKRQTAALAPERVRRGSLEYFAKRGEVAGGKK